MSVNGIAFNLDEFNQQVVKHDFQRNNMFSVVFATRPSSKTQQSLEQLGGAIYSQIPDRWDILGIGKSALTTAATQLITLGTRKLTRKAGVSKFLIGAMTNRVVQSLLGQYEVGTFLLDFFDMSFPTSGLMIYAVQMPENRLNYEMDRNHNAPNIKLTGRDFEPLIMSFRMSPDASNYIAMQDWVNSFEDPITGLRGLPADIEADIQVNLHHRSGLPHTVAMFSGCIPVAVTAPELSYDNDNQISTFNVTFAYRSMQVGPVSGETLLDITLELADSGIQQKAKDLGVEIPPQRPNSRLS